MLIGECGKTISANVINCAPCHLVNISTPDRYQEIPEASHPGEVCTMPHREDVMLICDSCGLGWHIYCLIPPLTSVPDDPIWLCKKCIESGIDPETLVIPQPAPKISRQELAGRKQWADARKLDKAKIIRKKGTKIHTGVLCTATLAEGGKTPTFTLKCNDGYMEHGKTTVDVRTRLANSAANSLHTIETNIGSLDTITKVSDLLPELMPGDWTLDM